MKRLLPMILLLCFSLPTLAADVRLVCSYVDKHGDKHAREIGFDEAAKTITLDGSVLPVGLSVTHSGIPTETGYRYICSIDNLRFGCSAFKSEGDSPTVFDFPRYWEVSRIDGEYLGGVVKGEIEKGKCVPFKQAF